MIAPLEPVSHNRSRPGQHGGRRVLLSATHDIHNRVSQLNRVRVDQLLLTLV